ncbi:unnamed protein product [Amoebophrya sp. A120]|nr:unnamed protein product [Amoebophrya sp. A120]|eukprot:GSA120T00006172001.1
MPNSNSSTQQQARDREVQQEPFYWSKSSRVVDHSCGGTTQQGGRGLENISRIQKSDGEDACAAGNVATSTSAFIQQAAPKNCAISGETSTSSTTTITSSRSTAASSSSTTTLSGTQRATTNTCRNPPPPGDVSLLQPASTLDPRGPAAARARAKGVVTTRSEDATTQQSQVRPALSASTQEPCSSGNARATVAPTSSSPPKPGNYAAGPSLARAPTPNGSSTNTSKNLPRGKSNGMSLHLLSTGQHPRQADFQAMGYVMKQMKGQAEKQAAAQADRQRVQMLHFLKPRGQDLQPNSQIDEAEVHVDVDQQSDSISSTREGGVKPSSCTTATGKGVQHGKNADNNRNSSSCRAHSGSGSASASRSSPTSKTSTSASPATRSSLREYTVRTLLGESPRTARLAAPTDPQPHPTSCEREIAIGAPRNQIRSFFDTYHVGKHPVRSYSAFMPLELLHYRKHHADWNTFSYRISKLVHIFVQKMSGRERWRMIRPGESFYALDGMTAAERLVFASYYLCPPNAVFWHEAFALFKSAGFPKEKGMIQKVFEFLPHLPPSLPDSPRKPGSAEEAAASSGSGAQPAAGGKSSSVSQDDMNNTRCGRASENACTSSNPLNNTTNAAPAGADADLQKKVDEKQENYERKKDQETRTTSTGKQPHQGNSRDTFRFPCPPDHDLRTNLFLLYRRTCWEQHFRLGLWNFDRMRRRLKSRGDDKNSSSTATLQRDPIDVEKENQNLHQAGAENKESPPGSSSKENLDPNKLLVGSSSSSASPTTGKKKKKTDPDAAERIKTASMNNCNALVAQPSASLRPANGASTKATSAKNASKKAAAKAKTASKNANKKSASASTTKKDSPEAKQADEKTKSFLFSENNAAATKTNAAGGAAAAPVKNHEQQKARDFCRKTSSSSKHLSTEDEHDHQSSCQNVLHASTSTSNATSSPHELYDPLFTTIAFTDPRNYRKTWISTGEFEMTYFMTQVLLRVRSMIIEEEEMGPRWEFLLEKPFLSRMLEHVIAYFDRTRPILFKDADQSALQGGKLLLVERDPFEEEIDRVFALEQKNNNLQPDAGGPAAPPANSSCKGTTSLHSENSSRCTQKNKSTELLLAPERGVDDEDDEDDEADLYKDRKDGNRFRFPDPEEFSDATVWDFLQYNYYRAHQLTLKSIFELNKIGKQYASKFESHFCPRYSVFSIDPVPEVGEPEHYLERDLELMVLNSRRKDGRAPRDHVSGSTTSNSERTATKKAKTMNEQKNEAENQSEAKSEVDSKSRNKVDKDNSFYKNINKFNHAATHLDIPREYPRGKSFVAIEEVVLGHDGSFVERSYLNNSGLEQAPDIDKLLVRSMPEDLKGTRKEVETSRAENKKEAEGPREIQQVICPPGATFIAGGSTTGPGKVAREKRRSNKTPAEMNSSVNCNRAITQEGKKTDSSRTSSVRDNRDATGRARTAKASSSSSAVLSSLDEEHQTVCPAAEEAAGEGQHSKVYLILEHHNSKFKSFEKEDRSYDSEGFFRNTGFSPLDHPLLVRACETPQKLGKCPINRLERYLIHGNHVEQFFPTGLDCVFNSELDGLMEEYFARLKTELEHQLVSYQPAPSSLLAKAGQVVADTGRAVVPDAGGEAKNANASSCGRGPLVGTTSSRTPAENKMSGTTTQECQNSIPVCSSATSRPTPTSTTAASAKSAIMSNVAPAGAPNPKPANCTTSSTTITSTTRRSWVDPLMSISISLSHSQTLMQSTFGIGTGLSEDKDRRNHYSHKFADLMFRPRMPDPTARLRPDMVEFAREHVKHCCAIDYGSTAGKPDDWLSDTDCKEMTDTLLLLLHSRFQIPKHEQPTTMSVPFPATFSVAPPASHVAATRKDSTSGSSGVVVAKPNKAPPAPVSAQGKNNGQIVAPSAGRNGSGEENIKSFSAAPAAHSGPTMSRTSAVSSCDDLRIGTHVQKGQETSLSSGKSSGRTPTLASPQQGGAQGVHTTVPAVAKNQETVSAASTSNTSSAPVGNGLAAPSSAAPGVVVITPAHLAPAKKVSENETSVPSQQPPPPQQAQITGGFLGAMRSLFSAIIPGSNSSSPSDKTKKSSDKTPGAAQEMFGVTSKAPPSGGAPSSSLSNPETTAINGGKTKTTNFSAHPPAPPEQARKKSETTTQTSATSSLTDPLVAGAAVGDDLPESQQMFAALVLEEEKKNLHPRRLGPNHDEAAPHVAAADVTFAKSQDKNSAPNGQDFSCTSNPTRPVPQSSSRVKEPSDRRCVTFDETTPERQEQLPLPSSRQPSKVKLRQGTPGKCLLESSPETSPSPAGCGSSTTSSVATSQSSSSTANGYNRCKKSRKRVQTEDNLHEAGGGLHRDGIAVALDFSEAGSCRTCGGGGEDAKNAESSSQKTQRQPCESNPTRSSQLCPGCGRSPGATEADAFGARIWEPPERSGTRTRGLEFCKKALEKAAATDGTEQKNPKAGVQELQQHVEPALEKDHLDLPETPISFSASPKHFFVQQASAEADNTPTTSTLFAKPPSKFAGRKDFALKSFLRAQETTSTTLPGASGTFCGGSTHGVGVGRPAVGAQQPQASVPPSSGSSGASTNSRSTAPATIQANQNSSAVAAAASTNCSNLHQAAQPPAGATSASTSKHMSKKKAGKQHARLNAQKRFCPSAVNSDGAASAVSATVTTNSNTGASPLAGSGVAGSSSSASAANWGSGGGPTPVPASKIQPGLGDQIPARAQDAPPMPPSVPQQQNTATPRGEQSGNHGLEVQQKQNCQNLSQDLGQERQVVLDHCQNNAATAGQLQAVAKNMSPSAFANLIPTNLASCANPAVACPADATSTPGGTMNTPLQQPRKAPTGGVFPPRRTAFGLETLPTTLTAEERAAEILKEYKKVTTDPVTGACTADTGLGQSSYIPKHTPQLLEQMYGGKPPPTAAAAQFLEQYPASNQWSSKSSGSPGTKAASGTNPPRAPAGAGVATSATAQKQQKKKNQNRIINQNTNNNRGPGVNSSSTAAQSQPPQPEPERGTAEYKAMLKQKLNEAKLRCRRQQKTGKNNNTTTSSANTTSGSTTTSSTTAATSPPTSNVAAQPARGTANVAQQQPVLGPSSGVAQQPGTSTKNTGGNYNITSSQSAASPPAATTRTATTSQQEQQITVCVATTGTTNTKTTAVPRTAQDKTQQQTSDQPPEAAPATSSRTESSAGTTPGMQEGLKKEQAQEQPGEAEDAPLPSQSQKKHKASTMLAAPAMAAGPYQQQSLLRSIPQMGGAAVQTKQSALFGGPTTANHLASAQNLLRDTISGCDFGITRSVFSESEPAFSRVLHVRPPLFPRPSTCNMPSLPWSGSTSGDLLAPPKNTVPHLSASSSGRHADGPAESACSGASSACSSTLPTSSAAEKNPVPTSTSSSKGQIQNANGVGVAAESATSSLAPSSQFVLKSELLTTTVTEFFSAEKTSNSASLFAQASAEQSALENSAHAG